MLVAEMNNLENGEESVGGCSSNKQQHIALHNVEFIPPACVQGVGPMAHLLVTRSIVIPLGSYVRVTCCKLAEAQCLSFLALISKVIRPTRGFVSCPPSKWAVMLPPLPVGSPPNTRVVDSLKFVGAPDMVAVRMARILGLKPEVDCDRLAPGEVQTLALGRALLRDPEILVLAAPFAFIEKNMRLRLAKLLRVWQAHVSTYLVGQLQPPSSEKGCHDGVTSESTKHLPEAGAHIRRTLVIPDAGYPDIQELDQLDDVVIDLDAHIDCDVDGKHIHVPGRLEFV